MCRFSYAQTRSHKHASHICFNRQTACMVDINAIATATANTDSAIHVQFLITFVFTIAFAFRIVRSFSLSFFVSIACATLHASVYVCEIYIDKSSMDLCC